MSRLSLKKMVCLSLQCILFVVNFIIIPLSLIIKKWSTNFYSYEIYLFLFIFWSFVKDRSERWQKNRCTNASKRLIIFWSFVKDRSERWQKNRCTNASTRWKDIFYYFKIPLHDFIFFTKFQNRCTNASKRWEDIFLSFKNTIAWFIYFYQILK